MGSQVPTSMDCIANWKGYRTNEESVKNIFSTEANGFALKVGSMSAICNRLHIYFGQATSENSTGGLAFYAVPSICDYKTNIDTEYGNYQKSHSGTNKTKNDYVSSKLVPTNFTHIAFNYTVKEYPQYEVLINSVNNWNNMTTRNEWISAQFPDGSGSVLAAFVIDISDFELFHEHTCFLALKENEKALGGYAIDLVVVNTTTGQILNFMENETGVSLRDLARPVPPFDPGIIGEFGIYELT